MHPLIAPAFHTGGIKCGGHRLEIKRVRVAELTVTSGRVIIADALMPHEKPLEVMVPPGRYPVVLSRVALPEDEERNAFATLEVSKSPAVSWEWAGHVGAQTRPIDHREQADGFPVSSWHAGFMDVEARSAMEKRFQSREITLAGEHDAHDGSWNEHSFPETPANVVTCFSGLGDGFYPVCVGRDRSGKVTALVIDFGVLPQ